jgi:hypothetical protein
MFSLICLLALLAPVSTANADSLWDPDFEGYIVDGSGVEIGAALVVRITPSTELTLTSAYIDSSEGRLSFSGGSGTGLLDFLPQASSATSREVEQESAYELDTRLGAVITDRDDDGLYYLEGERSLSINGSRESLRVSGWFSPRQVQPDGSIHFDMLHRSLLEYTSPGLDQAEVLRLEDIQETEMPEVRPETAPTDPEEAAGPEEAAVPESPAEAEEADAGTAAGSVLETMPAAGSQAPDTQTERASRYQLTEEKQKQLLLRFFNRFISTILTE